MLLEGFEAALAKINSIKVERDSPLYSSRTAAQSHKYLNGDRVCLCLHCAYLVLTAKLQECMMLQVFVYQPACYRV